MQRQLFAVKVAEVAVRNLQDVLVGACEAHLQSHRRFCSGAASKAGGGNGGWPRLRPGPIEIGGHGNDFQGCRGSGDNNLRLKNVELARHHGTIPNPASFSNAFGSQPFFGM